MSDTRHSGGETDRERPDPFVSLAYQAIETYVRTGETVVGELSLPESEPHGGVFVSLHMGDGSLRGCLGTVAPTRASLTEEVVANAVAAASQDPRFLPVSPQELGALDVSVDVLGEPEEVSGLEDLDPARYGVIVRGEHGRQALLLPDLAGVTSAEQQVDITCRKGGIDPRRDRYRLFRFTVTRHHGRPGGPKGRE